MSKKLLNEYVVPFLNEEYGEYYMKELIKE